jgi:hypothetical protein
VTSPCGDGDVHGDENFAKNDSTKNYLCKARVRVARVRFSWQRVRASKRWHAGRQSVQRRGGGAWARWRAGLLWWRVGRRRRAATVIRRRWAASSGLTDAEARRGGTARARAWMAPLRARERGHGGGAVARRGGDAQGRGEIGDGWRRRRKNARSECTVKKGEIRFLRDDRTRWSHDRTRWRQRPVIVQ